MTTVTTKHLMTETIAELRRLNAEATPGEWAPYSGEGGHFVLYPDPGHEEHAHRDPMETLLDHCMAVGALR